jgi:hypothetical protein
MLAGAPEGAASCAWTPHQSAANPVEAVFRSHRVISWGRNSPPLSESPAHSAKADMLNADQRYDAVGTLRLIARTTPLPTAVRRDLARRLHPGGLDHLWHGRRFSAGWGTRGELEYHPVRPDLVAEFVADTAIDEGRYRHPVRFLRVRAENAPHQMSHAVTRSGWSA